MNKLFVFLAIFSMAIVATAQTTIAKIGDTEYSDLQTAANALKYGEVLTLVADVTLEDDACIEFKNSGGGTYTLDLNGHNVTGKTEDGCLFYSKTVLIITGEGKVENTADNSDAFAVAKGATIIINGGTYKSGADICYLSDFDANITINDGRFTAPILYLEQLSHKGLAVKGGLFNCNKKSLTDCVAQGYVVVDNTDEATKAAYPYAVKQIVAKIGNTEYTDLQVAINALQDGDELTLVADVTIADDITIYFENVGSCTLNLNGHDLTGKVQDCLICVRANTELTLTGEGKVENTVPNSDAFAVANGGKVIVDGGTYKGTEDVCFIYGGEVGNIVINDGKFSAPNFYYDGTGNDGITVKGGLFNCDKDNLTDCVAEGYEVVDNDDEATMDDYPYAVKKAAVVAKIGDTEYTNLQAAINALQDGDELTLVADVTIADEVWLYFGNAGSYTLNLNGHNITGKVQDCLICVDANTELTLTGEGKVENTKPDSDAFAVSNGGKVIVDGGTYKGTEDVCLVYAREEGTIVINDGKFSAPNFYYEENGHDGFVVKGGLFNCDKENLTDCVAEGYEVVDNTDEATKDDYPYVVKKAAATPTGVETIGAEKAGKVIKTIENGEIVIIRDGVKYDLGGRKIE